ncbi:MULTISPECIES: efflux RND transporter periplasmic adaptor subunit [unclassified Rhizobium]|uniref:efflux RND transporter periplasmic adaptor subunit n=1 Tax=Rhizobium TaxID=379 RepID=UPI00084CA880|nr:MULTISPECIES: efflux RND transporter periplasmic adaptor subunit [unclassified Rhizobium]OEC92973.1 efflux transporter periplasmic adaptor subunit [Rhizobium sp. YK2]QYA12441.1 efflux RND transporter periplasmic adaptor subunit [Rhizobium sp. AB2/73]UEQ81628.1 efflux RND transporter periplasmic adaptor subunit [Rhizobium sp. AB2/73]
MKKLWLPLGLFVVAALAAWSYRDRLPFLSAFVDQASAETKDAGKAAQAGGKRQAGPIAVKTVAAVKTTLPMDVPATGWVVPIDSTTIAAQEAGLITQIAVKDGATVKAGDLIAKLDPRTAQAAVDKDKANITKDQANLAQAETALTRANSLLTSSAGTQATADEARATRDGAIATLSADQAQLASDQVLLGNTDIRAPYDGRLGDVQLSLGAYVSAGTPIVTISKYDPAYIKFTLQENNLRELQEQLAAGPVHVTTVPRSAQGKPRTGTITFYDNTVDEASGTIAVKATFENANGALWPGRSANVMVHFADNEQLTVVPTVAVSPGPDGYIAFVVKDNKVKITPVTIARANGGRTAVATGLSVGDHVVVEGQSQLNNGTEVKEQFSDNPNEKVASADDGKTETITVGAQQ